jgi:ATP-dependent Clp protease adapter protein ClpS
MMEAHTNGVALVMTCALEHAEFYCETLQFHGVCSVNALCTCKRKVNSFSPSPAEWGG